MSMLFAQPKNAALEGFYFDSVESYERQTEGLRGRFDDMTEGFEILFIEGEEIDGELFDALGIHQGNLNWFFKAASTWSDDEKIRVIIAVGECGDPFNGNSSPEDYGVDLYDKVSSLTELAAQFIEEGWLGETMKDFPHYLNMEAIAADLSKSYSVADIAGRRYVYHYG